MKIQCHIVLDFMLFFISHRYSQTFFMNIFFKSVFLFLFGPIKYCLLLLFRITNDIVVLFSSQNTSIELYTPFLCTFFLVIVGLERTSGNLPQWKWRHGSGQFSLRSKMELTWHVKDVSKWWWFFKLQFKTYWSCQCLKAA